MPAADARSRALLRFDGAVKREPAIDDWFRQRPAELGSIAREWFARMRECGGDVRELLHDGHPTACVGDAGFGYVNVFTAHVNVGFFKGAELPDQAGLLQGNGKYMRHVKLRSDAKVDEAALRALIKNAYRDMRARVEAE
jgi:hypothetical protein